MTRQPVRQTAAQAYAKAARWMAMRWQRRRDGARSSYVFNEAGRLEPLLGSEALSFPPPREETLALAALFCSHRFDLLGSGWRDVSFGAAALGVEGCRYEAEAGPLAARVNAANRAASEAIAARLPAWYRPIDWQRDMKSGYRWREDTWFADICYGRLPGVDVKVPWELSRMQHLPVLAYAYQWTGERRYADEFVCELTDWTAANPPRFGVNWRCTMDVGIRVANWLLAYDLFRAAGASFAPWFETLLADMTLTHGRHILANLEYSPALCSNHYLSDIAGLFFAAAHLSETPETTAWLAFCLQETVEAMRAQFGEDGANFEGSTSYHRLSTELMLYCTALGMGLSDARRAALRRYDVRLHRARPALRPLSAQAYDLANPVLFPAWYFARLARAVRFTERLMYDGHHVEQIGDNDSGRFLKLASVYARLGAAEARARYRNLRGQTLAGDEAYYDEDILDHSHIVRLGRVLFDGASFADAECEAFVRLCGGRRAEAASEDEPVAEANHEALARLKAELDMRFPPEARQTYRFPAEGDIGQGLRVFSYPDFGLYIFRSERLHMTARAGSVGQNGNGGHAHNDQLALTLHLDGRPAVRDPGTYLYTPLVARRNEFRATRAHFTVQKGGAEQNLWADGAAGVFSLLGDRTRAACLNVGTGGIAMRHEGYGAYVYRLVELLAHEVRVTDYGEGITRWEPMGLFSAGYGKVEEVGDVCL